MRDKDVRPNTYRLGRAAIKRLNDEEKNYHDWLAAADAFVEARVEALEKLGMTGSNKPTHRLGGGYNKAFGEILQREKLGTDVVDSATRNQLFEIKDNIADIEAFRSELTPHERGKLNHPSTILRHWKAWLREAARKNGQPTDGQRKQLSAAKRTSQELALALETIEKQKVHIAELEASSSAAPAAPVGKNPLTGYDHGQIVDFVKALKASTKNAVVHDLVKETEVSPKKAVLTIDQHFAALVELLAEQPTNVVMTRVKEFHAAIAEAAKAKASGAAPKREGKIKKGESPLIGGDLVIDLDAGVKQ